MDGIEQVVPRLLEDPNHNVIMDGAMSTFALYWAASGEAGAGSRTNAFPVFACCLAAWSAGRFAMEVALLCARQALVGWLERVKPLRSLQRTQRHGCFALLFLCMQSATCLLRCRVSSC